MVPPDEEKVCPTVGRPPKRCGRNCGRHSVVSRWGRLERMVSDPIELEGKRGQLLARLSELRQAVADLSDEYAGLPESGLIIDTVGAGALTTPGYCVAGAREVLQEALIELDAASDAMERAAQYTARLRGVVFD